jgi:hypothetical protein
MLVLLLVAAGPIISHHRVGTSSLLAGGRYSLIHAVISAGTVAGSCACGDW